MSMCTLNTLYNHQDVDEDKAVSEKHWYRLESNAGFYVLSNARNAFALKSFMFLWESSTGPSQAIRSIISVTVAED